MLGIAKSTNVNQEFDRADVLRLAKSHNFETASLEKVLDPNQIFSTTNSEFENAGLVAARIVKSSCGQGLNSGQAMELLSFGIDCLTQASPRHYAEKPFQDRLITLTHVNDAFSKIILEALPDSKIGMLPKLAEKVQNVGQLLR